MNEHNKRILDELEAQMTWDVAELGVAEGLTGQEGKDFSDFTRFVEGSYKPGDGPAALDWSELSEQDAKRFRKWLPRR